MQIKLDPSIDDAPHTIEIPGMIIEGREQAEKIVAMINKHAAALWPKPRQPRAKKPVEPSHGFSPAQAPAHKPAADMTRPAKK